jgi:hypothetical protein
MSKFFIQHVSPVSPSRAKVSVHLLAAGDRGIDEECRDEGCSVDGHLYSFKNDGLACCVKLSYWKESLSRISVAPPQDFTGWQMPTSCLAGRK